MGYVLIKKIKAIVVFATLLALASIPLAYAANWSQGPNWTLGPNWGGEATPTPTPTTSPTPPAPTPTAPTPTPTITPVPTEGIIVATEPLYFRSDNQTSNTVSGYKLSMTNTANTETMNNTLTVASMTYAFRVWIVNYQGVATEITSGSPVANITRSDSGYGMQTSTWAFPGTTLDVGYDALEIVVYIETNTGWLARATFITPSLIDKSISASTWTFSLYTNKTGTEASFSFGGGDKPSWVSGISFVTPNNFEIAGYYLQTGNILMFIFYQYTQVFGAAAYLLMWMIPMGTLYIRHRTTNVFVFLFSLLGGGAGSIMWVFIPGWAAAVVDALLLIMGGALVWKVMR